MGGCHVSRQYAREMALSSMNTVDCLLSCGCWQRMRLDLARVNCAAVCDRHSIRLEGVEYYIAKVNRYEWHVRCTQPGCSYGRWFGQSEGLARRANGRHASKHAHLGGVAYDQVTWDGRGTIFRDFGSSQRYTRRPASPPETTTKLTETYGPPPF